jgi:hypothetical protein
LNNQLNLKNINTIIKQMKKTVQRLVVVGFMIAGFAIQSYAQGVMKAEGNLGTELVSSDLEARDLKMKANYSNWQYPVEAITQLTSLDRFVSFLFQDSAVVFVSDDGTARHNTWISVGAVFTPNDENLELIDDNIRLSRFNEYTVDSLYFPYLYVRYVDSIDIAGTTVPVVDTLIVQFFKSQQLDTGGFIPTGEDREIFMKPGNWTQSILGSNNTSYEVRIPLTAVDTTSRPSSEGWGSSQRVVALPSGFNIGSDAANDKLAFTNATGFSISYATMVPYSFGDTMENRAGGNTVNRVNYFGHSMFQNSSIQVKQKKYQNNSWWVPKTIAYGEDQNGWENSVPGNAYFDDRYLNYALYITTETLGAQELDNNVTFGVYPNPVSKSDILKADFNLVNASDVTIDLYDLLGNKVKEIANGYFTSGEHTTDVSVNDLNAGLYIYSIRAGNSIATKKVTIVD